MSTLMHLPADGLGLAVSELRRVLRRDAVAEIGVWGADVAGVTGTREWIAPDGRFFLLRSDAGLCRELERLGRIEDFRTWPGSDTGGHYQWARVRV